MDQPSTSRTLQEEETAGTNKVYYEGDNELILMNDHIYVTEEDEEDGDENTIYQYDPVSYDTSRSYMQVYELYQPLVEAGTNALVCRICLQAGQHNSFATRQQFQHHRYKSHGTFAHSLPCPLVECSTAHASLQSLKNHLKDEHDLPIETHHRTFPDMQRFEQWRQLLEGATGSKFVLHNKQRESRRQVMHCARSEHKNGTAPRKIRAKQLENGHHMSKQGACCPGHISYTLEKDGSIDVIYQMMHVGHGASDRGAENDQNTSVTADFRLPHRPNYLGEQPMQFLQIDIVEMSVSLYGMTRYTHVLLITDLRTKYIWARPLQDFFDRNLIVRHFVDIFSQFGVPEGFSSSMNFELVRDAMRVMSYIFKTQIVEIGNQTPDYLTFRRTLYDMAANELNNRDRWAELIPFACMQLNQTARGGETVPFELMFGRTAFPVDEEESVAPAWLPPAHAPPTIVFQTGDKVYMRNFDSTLKDSRKEEMQPENVVLGLVGDVDWRRPSFPYHIYYSRDRENHWPDRNCEAMYVSAFDLAPSSIELLLARDENRRQMLQTLLCSCKAGSSEEPPCTLVRSELCAKGMSRSCCGRTGSCCYHEELEAGAGETYFKVQQISRKYREPGGHSIGQNARKKPDVLKMPVKTRNAKGVPRRKADNLLSVVVEPIRSPAKKLSIHEEPSEEFIDVGEPLAPPPEDFVDRRKSQRYARRKRTSHH